MKRRNFIGTCAQSIALLVSGCQKKKSPEKPTGALVDPESLYENYRTALLDDIVPFWENYGVDHQHGGLMTCLTDDGVLMSEKKYTYSVARGLWTFSALYSMIEKRESWRRIAEDTFTFLTAHAIDKNGDWVYAMERDGTVTEGPVSIWSDCFACYGLIEYARAFENHEALDLAGSTLARIVERTSRDDFNAIAPYTMTHGVITHGISMMQIVLADEYLRIEPSPEIEIIQNAAVNRVLNCHLDNEQKLLFENVRRDCTKMDNQEGRFVLPGHPIECMWKIMRSGMRTGNRNLTAEAAHVMRWHLEAGWDKEYGGIFYSLDSSGDEPDLPPYPRWDLKMWWVHAEALYGTLLAYELTGETWCAEWFNEIHDYTFGHYPAGPGKDWHERLTREGEVMTETVNLPVKDFFHTPRMCLYVMESLDRIRNG